MGADRPSNALVVVLDTVRKDHLTPYGYDRPTAPELAAFAEEATVFESAVAPAPWTLPVHASMFTGLYPSQHGADQESPYLDDVATLASILSAAGYDTGCFSANAWITPYTELTRGFDEHDSFFEVLPRDLLSGSLGRAWRLVNDDDRLRGLATRLVRVGAKAHARLASGERASSKTPAVLDRTRAFVEASDAEAGWFAFVNLMDAHLPYYPPDEYRERFAPGVDPSSVCQNSKAHNAGAREVDEEEWSDIRSLYDAEIAYLDAQLGRLFDWLRETGRWDDTAVVVCADHGELLGEHGLYGHEFALYEELINVPLVVKHPSIEPGRRSGLVELLDLYHTTLDALDVDPAGVSVGRDVIASDPARSLLDPGYRTVRTADVDAAPSSADPGRAAVVESGASADYAFVEYARPVIELHHLEEKAAAAGIELPADHRAKSRMRAARGLEGKYVRADRIPDEGYRVDVDPREQSPVDATDDDAVSAAERALATFERRVGDEWTEPAADPRSDAEDVLSDADGEIRGRLRKLGYLE